MEAEKINEEMTKLAAKAYEHASGTYTTSMEAEMIDKEMANLGMSMQLRESNEDEGDEGDKSGEDEGGERDESSHEHGRSSDDDLA